MSNTKRYNCESPNCDRTILLRIVNPPKNKYCSKCKEAHTLRVLKVQKDWDSSIEDTVLDLSKFCNYITCNNVSEAIGIPRTDLMEIIKKYFNVNSWEEFKKKNYPKCKNKLCCIVDCGELFKGKIENKYYITRKLIKDYGICSCLLKQDKRLKNYLLICLSSISNMEDIHKKIVLKQKK